MEKICPFCGGDAEVYMASGGRAVSCDNCDITMLVDVWNTRAAPKVKPLVFDEGTHAVIADAPFFGRFRLENYGGKGWVVCWSCPGYSASFIDGHFNTMEEAKAALHDKYQAAFEAMWEGV